MPDYATAEQQFVQLLTTEALDQHVTAQPALTEEFEATLAQALAIAYITYPDTDAANWFLQRILYRINRLNLFWYDDLTHYINERSIIWEQCVTRSRAFGSHGNWLNWTFIPCKHRMCNRR